jgi:hypothetical protein
MLKQLAVEVVEAVVEVQQQVLSEEAEALEAAETD